MTAQVLAFPRSEKIRREAMLAKKRAYYATNREPILAKQRAKYAGDDEYRFNKLGDQIQRRREKNVEKTMAWLAAEGPAVLAELKDLLKFKLV